MRAAASIETVHATCVAIDGRAVLITGPSGAGKSDLALRLLDRGFHLISDDRTCVRLHEGRLVASPPPQIAGKLEVRGIGIVDVEHDGEAPVALVVELTDAVDRLPEEERTRSVCGAALPLVSVDARTASAPAKVALALDRLGLR